MALHFTEDELAQRRAATIAAMELGGIDALLMFRQESMFYLTGYDTFGYVFFQCLVLDRKGRMALLTRAPDLRQAQNTSVVDDIRIWKDLPDVSPADQLRDMLDDFGLKGATLGVEWEAYGLTARNGQRVTVAMDGYAELVDASELVSRLRVVKSPAEIAYVRRSAELADDAYDAAKTLTAAGADEGKILAAMQGAVFEGGGDYPGNEFIIGSAGDALLCRYKSGRRVLDSQDQLTLEWAGVYRRYHAAMMRTFVIGSVPARQQALFEAALAALLAVEGALTPGATFGDGFDAHARVMDDAGLSDHRLNACGYSLGTTFAPNWMDWPMLYHGNPAEVRAGMTIFCHMILFDSDADLAMSLGETVLITDTGAERLSRSPLDLVVA